MNFNVTKTTLSEVQSLRKLFLSECSFQFICDKCHGAGWADIYVFTSGKEIAGYGSLWGKDKREDRDTIFEFYLLPSFRNFADTLYPEFIKASGALFIECQSNDLLLSGMLFQHAKIIQAEAILFEYNFQTTFNITGTTFKERIDAEGNSDYILEQNGIPVASGGYVWNYNFPYIDIYYEVVEAYRQKGFGSLIIQELKKEAFRLKRVPSARCNVQNLASKKALLKAGMRVCGHLLIGELP
jgi:GNAT superfamily N-acetyltransferase